MPAGALHALFITLIISMFTLLDHGAFAQDAPGAPDQNGAVSEETIIINPHTAREQEITLAEGSAADIAPRSTAAYIFQILLMLALVAAAIYVLVFIVKKASRGKTAQDPFLKKLASLPLTANRSACVLSVGTQAWLVGVSENSVSLISEINDKEIIDAMILEEAKKTVEAEGPITDFKSLLRKFGVKIDSSVPGPDNIRKRRERLKGL